MPFTPMAGTRKISTGVTAALMRRMRKQLFARIVIAILILVISIPFSSGQAEPRHQTNSSGGLPQEILELLTPEERVGQLFLLTFQGNQVGPGTQIHDLVNNYYIGGVVLLAENDNFTGGDYTPNNLWDLINELQTLKYENSNTISANSTSNTGLSTPFIPLFIGISQEGDGYPTDQILNGLTPLPSQLAIGATWNTNLAYRVGAVAGEELSALGINLLFGPSLDVLENPLIGGASELGVRSFGGDPFWVGEMGRAYVKGLHEGSKGNLAVVGTHFPGLGSSDRLPTEEVATVRKSLEQLKQIELSPFFAVTGNAISDTEKVDALLTSHIRYQGLQGNIRSTTRPISFDQQALGLLMDLPEFSSWRDEGGVMISDDLGSRAVRRFYDPTEQEFNAKRLALDAFLAGNDLLYVNDFTEPGGTDPYTTTVSTIEFFTQKYQEDTLFAERVDESVLRILTLKLGLYDSFSLDYVLTSGEINTLGNSEQITFDVAQQGATLISPELSEFDSILPDTPERTDRIVFLTDDYPIRQCSRCQVQSVLGVEALELTILNLYGPQAGGRVSQFYMESYTFLDLQDMLNGIEGTNTIESDIRSATWIVVTMLDVTDDRPESQAFNRFLSERPDLTRNKRIIVFAANSPNYLDATDISKLTAYFGLFSKAPPFIEVAARLLFKEIAIPNGALPVSVPGVGYDLISATSPRSDQTIPLYLNFPEWVGIDLSSIPEDIIPPEFEIGETLPLVTGIILDENDNPVPNHTPVQFVINIDGVEIPAVSTTTTNGVAHLEFLIPQSGNINIQAISSLAKSETISFAIPFQESTQVPTPTTTPTETPTSEPLPTSIPPTPIPTPPPEEDQTKVGLGDWFGALIATIFIGWGASRTGALLGKVRWGIRWGLSAIIGGLLLYSYVLLEFPGSSLLLFAGETWGLFLAASMGAILGWLVALGFFFSQKRPR
jgi:beta-N-acetylhexosaminidase